MSPARTPLLGSVARVSGTVPRYDVYSPHRPIVYHDYGGYPGQAVGGGGSWKAASSGGDVVRGEGVLELEDSATLVSGLAVSCGRPLESGLRCARSAQSSRA